MVDDVNDSVRDRGISSQETAALLIVTLPPGRDLHHCAIDQAFFRSTLEAQQGATQPAVAGCTAGRFRCGTKDLYNLKLQTENISQSVTASLQP